MDTGLAKTDLGIAAHYADLVEDKRRARRIFAAIRAEFERTQDTIAVITDDAARLATQPALAQSIAHRFAYVDPLNHLQVELMRRYRQRRADDPQIERVQRGIQLSINGVAAGLRNTG